MVRTAIRRTRTGWFPDYQTDNYSFILMSNLLKKKGIRNHTFMLKLYDADLIGVDVFDEANLSIHMRTKIAIECSRNFWFFLRQCACIPEAGDGTRYELNRGNMAASWAYLNNINSYLIMPRQHGKTWAAIMFTLWLFLFGGRGIKMLYTNKSLSTNKENLSRLKEARALLPSYLRLTDIENHEGGIGDITDNKTEIINGLNNSIRLAPSPANENRADQAARGLTLPIVLKDEFGFELFNEVIWTAMMPAWSKASERAREKGIPSSFMITTTPGDLRTPHGTFAKDVMDKCAVFYEGLYDETGEFVSDWLIHNSKNRFLFIQFNYIQLSHSRNPEEWFAKQCDELMHIMHKIRREVLIQWINTTSSSPYNADDINELSSMAIPAIDTETITINRYYRLQVFRPLSQHKKYLMGVDPSRMRSIKSDNSAVTIVDAETQELCAVFTSNVMGHLALFQFIYTLIVYHIPNTVIVVESNMGDTIIEYIRNSAISHLLYYEFTDDATREKWEKGSIKDSNITDVRYGIETTGSSRPKMFDILFEYVTEYKEKICVEPMVYEISCLEMGKNGRIQHASGKNDDIVLSYLMTQYVMRYGKNKSRFGLYSINNADGAIMEAPGRLAQDNSIFDSTRHDRTKVKSESMRHPFFKGLFEKQNSIQELVDQWQNSLTIAKGSKDSDFLDNGMSDFELMDRSHNPLGLTSMTEDAFSYLNDDLGAMVDVADTSSIFDKDIEKLPEFSKIRVGRVSK